MCDTIYSVEDIKAVLHPVFTKHNVKKAILFGSYVKGLADHRSDVDLLLDSGLRGLEFIGLIEDVRLALDKEVDVFDKTHIVPNSKIFSEISRDGVVIYCSKEKAIKRLPQNYNVHVERSLLEKLTAYFGQSRIKVVEKAIENI